MAEHRLVDRLFGLAVGAAPVDAVAASDNLLPLGCAYFRALANLPVLDVRLKHTKVTNGRVCNLCIDVSARSEGHVCPVRGLTWGLTIATGTIVVHTWQSLIVVLCIHHGCECNLLDVGQTGCLTCSSTCLCEHREEDCGENRDNRDDDEKLDEREGVT